jgi:hypothetical protein
MNARPLLFASVAAVLAAATAPALAHHAVPASDVQAIALADGATLFTFRDGKMAKADRHNRPVYLAQGEVLRTQDGRQIVAMGNEVARLASLFAREHGN